MPASTFQSESFQKMLVIGVQDQRLAFINSSKTITKLWKKTVRGGIVSRYLEKLNVS